MHETFTIITLKQSEISFYEIWFEHLKNETILCLFIVTSQRLWEPYELLRWDRN